MFSLTGKDIYNGESAYKTIILAKNTLLCSYQASISFDLSNVDDFQNSVDAPIPKAKQNEYVEDRLTNGHANGPVGYINTTSAYAAFESLDSGDLIQFAWQIANGMV